VRPGRNLVPFGSITGTLHGDRASRCVWIAQGSTARQLVLFGDYRLDFTDGGVTVFEKGAVVAREGDTASFGGGMVTDAGVPGCPVAAADGQVWGAHGGRRAP
jgi:hypothetical protein